MANNKKGNLWILILVCVGCIIISTVAYVAMKASVQSEFLAVTVTLAVAIALCVCAWQIFTQLENMVPKSERERINAEKLAEEQAEEAEKLTSLTTEHDAQTSKLQAELQSARDQIAAMQKEQQNVAERHSRELEEARRKGAEEEQRKFANMNWLERIQKKLKSRFAQYSRKCEQPLLSHQRRERQGKAFIA